MLKRWKTAIVRPEKWDGSQVGFRGSSASSGRIVLPPGAFWEHGASKMLTSGASLLFCMLQCFRALEGMLPPGMCRTSRASAKRIVSCTGLCASSCAPKSHMHHAMRLFRGRELRTEHKLFSRTFRIPAKIPGYSAKSLVSLGFEGHTEVGTQPFTWKTPPHRKIYRTKS